MTPDLLREAGKALYGEQWQSALARAIGVNERTLRRWVTGKWDMPPSLTGDIAKICVERADALHEMAERLETERVEG